MRKRHSLCLLMLLSLGTQWLLSSFAGSAEVFQEIVVKEGDTLWGLANYYLKDPKRWPEILKYNNLPLTDPAVALPGMRLKVPILLIKEQLRKATLAWILNEVRYRKKDQAAWKRAIQNMELYNDDGLRTMEKSQAHVKFYSGDVFKMDENSLVILKPDLKEEGKSVEEVNLMSGAIRTQRTRVLTPTVRVTPQSRDTVYKAKVREDKATIVQVEKGKAEVFGLDTGKKVMVTAGFANITIPSQEPSAPVKAPAMPDFKVPEFSSTGEIILLRSDLKGSPSPEIQNQISKLELEPPKPEEYIPEKDKPESPASQPKSNRPNALKNWVSYRIVVAKDPKFSQILWEKRKRLESDRPATDSKEYQLPDGTYYRAVSYSDDSGNETPLKSLGVFEVRTRPPKIMVTSPPEGYQTREVLIDIEGQSDPDCFVTVNNYPVPVKPDGKFLWSAVLAKEGANKIKIVSRDRFGNRSELLRSVYLQTSSKE